MMVRLFVDDVEYTDYITDTPTLSAEFEDGKIIGNAPSVTLSINLDNSESLFDTTLLSKKFVVYDNTLSSKIGVFTVVDKPERITKELSLTLYDNMIDLNVAYNTNTTMYPTTIKKQIEEMETIIKKTIDCTDLGDVVLNYPAKWYDNTITIRDFLCFVGELGACNLFCTPNGDYKFKKISKEVKHILSDDDVENVDVIENFNCTRVMFDNGVINPLVKGNDTGNTIYLSPNNSYIETQEQIDYVYSVVGGMSFKTVEGLICVEISGLSLGDLTSFDGYNFITLNYTHDLMAGEYGIQTIDGNLTTKNAELVIQHIDDAVKIHRLKSEFDQEKLKWGVTAEKVDDNEKKIASLELSNEEISMRVEDTYTKGETDVQIENIVQQNANELSVSIGKVEEQGEKLQSDFNDLSVTIDGLFNKISSTGGNNLILNSMGVYEDGWTGNWLVDKSQEVKQRNIYGFAILLQNGELYQSISVPNGSYVLSFQYIKHIALSNVTLKVNDEEYVLSSEEYAQFQFPLEVETGTIEIYFIADTDNACTICNLMLNQGTEAMIWSLNANETWSDMMRMSSSGLEIDAAQSDVLFNAKADIIGFKNKNTKEYVAIFTDTGADMNELVVKKKARIVGILFQDINNHTSLNYVGGDD